jgi:short-subunit dehydrogenase
MTVIMLCPYCRSSNHLHPKESAMPTSSTRSAKGTALVTGASAGIGLKYAQRLAARGHDLLLVARRGDRLEQLAASLRAGHGVAVETLVADLATRADLDRVVHRLEHDDAIALLVNNAGVSTMGQVTTTAEADIAAMTDVNVTGLVRLSRAAIAAFKQRNRGTLINIGSVLGFHSLPFSAVYSATKGYVLNFTRGLQEEVAGTAVVVQLVLPSATATDIWELSGVPLSSLDAAQVMTADDLVDAALAGLDLGEKITLPSVEDARLFAAYDDARMKLLAASQSGRPASRYLDRA